MDIDESESYLKGQNEITAAKEVLISHEEMNHNVELVRSMKSIEGIKFIDLNLVKSLDDNAQKVTNYIGEKN